MTQDALFRDETKPCGTCAGTGMTQDPETQAVRSCPSCRGSGRDIDRPDPAYDPLPDSY